MEHGIEICFFFKTNRFFRKQNDRTWWRGTSKKNETAKHSYGRGKTSWRNADCKMLVPIVVSVTMQIGMIEMQKLECI